MLMDKNSTEGALLPQVPSMLKKGTVIEVFFEDGVWYLGRLMKRARGWTHEGPPRSALFPEMGVFAPPFPFFKNV